MTTELDRVRAELDRVRAERNRLYWIVVDSRVQDVRDHEHAMHAVKWTMGAMESPEVDLAIPSPILNYLDQRDRKKRGEAAT